MKIALLVLFVIFLIAIGPVLVIWSANTLFPALAIPYTIQTWIATIILAGVFKTTVNNK
jgi:NhaP-type Na+/H+ or K+/H+ antiporter